ncbi:MAG: tetratricopeptide repeat protein [Planctomycetaceae bacterium]
MSNFRRTQKNFRKQSAALLKSLWKTAVSPFRLLQKSLGWLFTSIGTWWKHRQLKHLLRGIPAVLLMSGAVYVLIGHRSFSTFQRGQRYLAAADREFNRENWTTAEQFFGRAIQLGINTPDVRFRLAQAAQKSGDTSRMIAILTALAPADRPVYAPAHLWQAMQLLSNATAERVQIATRHLKHALLLDPGNRTAHSLMGDLAYQIQDWPSAVQHLELSNPVSARNNLQLSKALLMTNNRSRAAMFADRAEKTGREEVKAAPDAVSSRIALAEALILQEKFEEALGTVSQGIALAPDDQELRIELGRVYLMWSEAFAASARPDPQRSFEVFQLLARALEQDPNNILIFDRIMKLLLAGGEIADRGEEILLQNISAGIVPGVSHLLLGTFTDATDQAEKAAFHLERAHALLTNAPIVSNNLAWHLMIQPQPELDRALKLIDAVVAKYPDNAAFRETRGQILVRLERYQEALEELEFALPTYRDQPELHESLIRIYEHLKLPDLAAQHQIILTNLQEKRNSEASSVAQ